MLLALRLSWTAEAEAGFVKNWILQTFGSTRSRDGEIEVSKWVCLKIGYIPNEIAIFHRDYDH